MDSIQNAPEEDESLIYLAGGGIGAIFLGMALVPLRDYTSASNFAFPFMALTIAVAEFGGRRAAVVTALTSALSLDFFLTQPYLRLTIAGKHDIIAFLGLAICGLIAAAFGTRRRRRTADLGAAHSHLDLLHATLQQLETPGSIELVLTKILDETRAALPLVAVVARDETARLLAVSGAERDRTVPQEVLRPDTLLPADGSERILPSGGIPLPEQGARLPLVAGNKQVGWLELWGNGARADAAARHALSDVARLLGILLARGGIAANHR
jgi:K+-sensing histidine kinase KdpD